MTSKIHADYPTQPRISASAASEPPLSVLNNKPPDQLLAGAILAQARHVELAGDEPLKDLKNGLIDPSEPILDVHTLPTRAQQAMASQTLRFELRAQDSEPPTSRLKTQLTPSSILAEPIGDAALMQPQRKSFAIRNFEQFRDRLIKLSKTFIEQIIGTSPELALNTQASLSVPDAAMAMSSKNPLFKMMTALLRSTNDLQTSAPQWLPPAQIDKLQTQAGLLRSALVQMMEQAAQLGATDQDTSDLPAQIDQLRIRCLEFAALMVEIKPPEHDAQHSPEMIEQATGLIGSTLEDCTDFADTLSQWHQTGGGLGNFENAAPTAAILNDDAPEFTDADTAAFSQEGMSSNVTGGGLSVLPFASRVAVGLSEADQVRYNDMVQAVNLDPKPAEYSDDESPMAEDGESAGQDSESEADSDANEDEAVGDTSDAGDPDFSDESASSESDKKRRRRPSRRSANHQGGGG